VHATGALAITAEVVTWSVVARPLTVVAVVLVAAAFLAGWLVGGHRRGGR
jgi:hypothetical protein